MSQIFSSRVFCVVVGFFIIAVAFVAFMSVDLKSYAQSEEPILNSSSQSSINEQPYTITNDGDIDTTFNSGSGIDYSVTDLVVQPDGKILIGGEFTTYNGVSRNRIARVNTDGSLDATFNLGSGANGYVGALALQPDGKILISGGFTAYNSISRKEIARVNGDGSLDTTFNPTSSFGAYSYGAEALAIQSDGKILIGGGFTTYNGISRNGIARVNGDGSLDTTFNPGSGINTTFIVRTLATQSDGKILIGGDFTTYNSISRNRIARINVNGSLDTTFNPGFGANDNVTALAIQPDGKIFIGGNFTTYNGVSRNRIALINIDGSLDTTFNPSSGANDTIATLAIQSGGKILIGGYFTTYNGIGRNSIARINIDGSLDTTFNPSSTGIAGTGALAIQPDEKILINNYFTFYPGYNTRGIARLLNSCSACATINITPSSGPQVTTTFSIIGNQFTPAGAIRQFLTYPNGTTTELNQLTANASGQFNTFYTTSCSDTAGNYSMRVQDVATNRQSNVANFIVTASPGCVFSPSINAITPSTVIVNQPTTLTVNGSNFQPNFTAEVTTPAGTFPIAPAGLTFVNANQVRVLVTMNNTPPYTATLRIKNADLQSATRAFQVTASTSAPEITDILPGPIPANVLTEVTVIGNNFPPATDFVAEVTDGDGMTEVPLAGRFTDSSNRVRLRFMVNSNNTLAPSSGNLRIIDRLRRFTSRPFQIAANPSPATPLKIKGIEITQGVQDINTSFQQFVKGRPTFVRVHVQSSVNAIWTNVTAKLTGRRINGGELGVATVANQQSGITITTNPQRTQLNDSFLFQLPDSWLQGNIELEFQGVNQQFSCNNGTNCNKKTINFTVLPSLEITLVKLRWDDGISHIPSNASLDSVEREIRAYLPLGNIDFKRGDLSGLSFNGRPRLEDVLYFMRQLYRDRCGNSFNCNRHFIGILADPPQNGSIGISNAPDYASVAYTGPSAVGTASHELAHALGRVHTRTPNGGERCPDLDYFNLHPDGQISQDKTDNGFFGFDVNSRRIYSPYTTDLMGYKPVIWLSDYNSRGIFNFLSSGGTSTPPRVPVTELNCFEPPRSFQNNSLVISSGENVLFVNGLISSTEETGQITSIYKTTTSNQTTIFNSGTYAIRYENSGQVLATYNFEPSFPLGNTLGSFNLFLPQNASANRIALLHNGIELASRQASANPPSVAVTSPNGGEMLNGLTATLQWTASDADNDALRYLIQYSSDAGASWQTLASDWTSTSYNLNLDNIAGTSQGLIRVIASDGFYSNQDQSDAYFSVNTHTPQVTIRAPLNNSYFVGDQNIVLDGGAIDAEEGQLSNSALVWTSNLNGSLGSGQTLTVNALDLAEGTHTITLTARDSTAQVGTASITVSTYRTAPVIPTTLNTAPDNLSFIAQQGTTNLSQPQILSVRNDGEGTLNWSASANQTWIQLGETTGTAPSNAEVRINPSGLALENYTGTITITTPDATNSPQTVNVSLTIVETLTPTGIVSGKVTYANALTTTSVPFTTLDAVGSIPLSTLTDSNGDYSLSGFASGAYTITPSKTNQVNGISSLDASRVAQHIVGLTVLNANQLIAADTSGNGAVSSLDAAYIAQFIVGIPNPSITGTWKFLPSSRSYPNVQSNQTNQDFSAILVGDVTGNWSPTGPLRFDFLNWNPTEPLRFDFSVVESEQTRQAEEAAKVVVVTAQRNQVGEEKTAMTLNLTAGETTGAGILGYQFDVLYDAAVIEPQAIGCDVSETLSSGMTAICRVSEPGVLKVVVFGATPLSGSGTMLRLNFKVIGARDSTSGVSIENFMFNEGMPNAVTVKGQW